MHVGHNSSMVRAFEWVATGSLAKKRRLILGLSLKSHGFSDEQTFSAVLFLTSGFCINLEGVQICPFRLDISLLSVLL